MSSRSLALTAIIISSLLWGTAGVAAKVLIREINPFVAAFYRFLIASLIILPFFLHEKKPRSVWRGLLPLSLVGAINVPLFYLGLKTTTANSASLIYAAVPLATAVLSNILIKEKSPAKRLVGILVGLLGVITIILLPALEKGEALSGALEGNLFITLAMLSWTLYTIGSRYFLAKNQFSPLTITSVYFFTITVVCLVLVCLSGQPFFTPTILVPKYLFTLIYSAIFITLVTYFLFQWAIQRISVTTASLKQYLELVFSVWLNVTLLGEKITAGFVFGSLLVIAGVAIATGSQLTQVFKKGLRRIS